MAINVYWLKITLNVNGWNVPIERDMVTERMKRQGPYIYFLQETPFSFKDTFRLKVKWEKDFSMKVDMSRKLVALLISYKIYLKTKTVKKIRQRRAMHNDKRVNPRRGYNIHKYLRAQHRITLICKANINRHKTRNW